MGYEPVLDVELSCDIGEWLLLDDHLMDDVNLIGGRQFAGGELLGLAIGIELVGIIGRI